MNSPSDPGPAREISELRRTQQQLRLSEARFRALTELSADWFWEQDQNFRFVEIEGGGRYPLGISPPDHILGKTRWELEGCEPAEGDWHSHRELLQRHEPFRDFELRRRAADGSERILSIAGSPVFDDKGCFTGYRGVGRDITETRRAELALRESESALAALMGNLPLEDFVRDITKRKQAQEEVAPLNAELEERVRLRTAQLEAANAELEAFAYSIAHDLRSPLLSIDGFSHMLDELAGQSIGDQGQHYLRRIRAAARQMSDLTDAMLSLARLSGVKLQWERVDLADMARAVEVSLRESAPARVATVEIPDHLYAQGDPRLLTQVFVNLLGNAWKFSASKPHTVIRVGSVREADGEPVYFVADQGAGFDMAHASRLFGAFQRLHATSEFEGTGIGLALVHRIISRHAGRIWAEARPGEGATFCFTLSNEPPS